MNNTNNIQSDCLTNMCNDSGLSGLSNTSNPETETETHLSKIELNRQRAREHYRKKVGIPVDVPLLPRGGARNIKYVTEEDKQAHINKTKEYQREYQLKYRQKKAELKKQALAFITKDYINDLQKQLEEHPENGYNISCKLHDFKTYEQSLLNK